ncbi:class B sortase [Roseburia hominis]
MDRKRRLEDDRVDDRTRRKHKKKYHRGRRKKASIGGIISTIILIVAVCVFCYSAFQLVQIQSGYKKGENEYDEIEEKAVSIDTEEDRYRVDFDTLRELNPDVVAWIRFDEPSVINYPVVQGKDNEEYLHKTFKGYDNTVGTIFVNVDNHPDFNDRNTIIYGHYMYNGTMFNDLEDYLDKEFWEKYPCFYIYTPDGAEIKYHIYAAGVVKDTSEGYTYQFADDAAFQSFLDTTKASGDYDTGVELDLSSQVVTLSTCTKSNNNDRMVIHAVKTGVRQ